MGWGGVVWCVCVCVCFGRVVIGTDETKGPHGVIQRTRCSRVSPGARVGWLESPGAAQSLTRTEGHRGV